MTMEALTYEFLNIIGPIYFLSQDNQLEHSSPDHNIIYNDHTHTVRQTNTPKQRYNHTIITSIITHETKS